MKLLLTMLLTALIQLSYAQIGVTINSDQAYLGYSLFHPNSNTSTFLIDNEGNYIHEWQGTHNPGRSVYLLENGLLLRTGDAVNTNFPGGGRGGRIELVDWDGTVTWSYNFSTFEECHHHDVQMLPNGNILAVLWIRYTADQAIASGRNPDWVDDYLLSEKIIEFTPIGKGSIDIVWEWDFWDHLIQDFDDTKDNFGIVEDYPHKLDINTRRGEEFTTTDWLHVNAIDYNEDLDQIAISSPFLNEIWIIDHSTTSEEASGSTGGLSGRGGDFLYRWGNPSNYNQGNSEDRQLYGQHNPEWVADGDGWMMTIFNNGFEREVPHSSIELITLPLESDGTYTIAEDGKFLPENPTRTYKAEIETDFYSRIISGAQLLPNNNLLICEGVTGRFFEVNEADEIVWEYINPVNSELVCDQLDTASIEGNAVFRVLKYPMDYSGIPEDLTNAEIKLDELGCEEQQIITSSFNEDEIQIHQLEHLVSIGNIQLEYQVKLVNLAGHTVYSNRNNQAMEINTSQFVGLHILIIMTKEKIYKSKLIF